MTGSPKSRVSNLVSLELPGPRAQAWPAEGKGGSGDENDVNKNKRFVQPRSLVLSPTRLSLYRDGSVENPGNEVDISCILALKRHFSNVTCI